VVVLVGINLSGAEFGSVGGTYGTDYIYPGKESIDYYASKGMDVIRLPFLWERVQPTKDGPLDTEELARIDQVVDYATSKGLKVVLDVHNYGWAYGSLVGSAALPNASFADLWGKLATHFKGNTNVMFGLMNEPHDQSAAQWIESANAAIGAIRRAGATQQILVPGTYWSGAHSWVSSGNSTVVGGGVVDPLHNFVFEVHQYLDSDSSGTSPNVVSPTVGVERLTEITNWARSTGNKLFLGEFGAAQDSASLTALDNMMAYMQQNADVWSDATYWGGGPWWGEYMFSVEPSDLASPVDMPQMGILEKYAHSTVSAAADTDGAALAPVFTSLLLADGEVTLTGTTGEANNTISLYDGDTWIGMTTTVTAAATRTDLGAALQAAMAGGYLAHLTKQTYTVSAPIVVTVNSTIQGPMGIDLGGATIDSHITDGSPVIQIVAGPGVDLRYVTLSNFTIKGNGREGDGIKIVADGSDRWVYNWTVSNVTVEHVGGYGLDVQGSVFEGMVSNSWMNGNARGGAYFADSAGGGVVSAIRWLGGGFQNNGNAGLILDNGVRDIGVDNASFVNNSGSGISALWGITSVTGSRFDNNSGAGVTFWNYGNFNSDTFSTTGSQTVGVSGYLAGYATLIGNTSAYTGGGSDPTVLANLQGNGGAFLMGDSGQVVTGSNVVVDGPLGASLANVSLSTQGVALPTLASVTSATTAAVPSSTGTGALETALRAAMAGGYVAHLTGTSYAVTTPIVINVTSSTQGPVGIDLGGAKIVSQITDGSPAIEIIVGRGVDLGSLTLSNFSIQGNGLEGDGIKIVADGNDRLLHDWSISNVSVEHVGGIGLDVLGNVSQGTVFDSWMHGDGQGGARFADSAGGGVAGGLEWLGGGFRKNGVAGLILDNGAHDMTVRGAYFVENNGPGIDATSGITLVQESGFENNQGAGAIVQKSANFTDDTFATWGVQTVGIGGYLAGGQVTLTGAGAEYYGAGPDPTVLANVQGNGALAIAGYGNVVVGPNVTVTGGNPGVSSLSTTTSVSDGTHTASPALIGQYAAASFVAAGDGHGGTMITDPATAPQNQLTTPQS
jgi:aryl-phospho-beta-D-glucosidase BglC (GH1 family)